MNDKLLLAGVRGLQRSFLITRALRALARGSGRARLRLDVAAALPSQVHGSACIAAHLSTIDTSQYPWMLDVLRRLKGMNASSW